MQGKKTVQELAGELNQLLARFKRNIDAVGSRELLKENYAAAYKKAVEVLRVTANSYVVALLESHVWPIHPDFEKEEMEIIKNVIESSGMVKKMSKRMMQQFSVEGLPEMADELYWLCRKRNRAVYGTENRFHHRLFRSIKRVAGVQFAYARG